MDILGRACTVEMELEKEVCKESGRRMQARIL